MSAADNTPAYVWIKLATTQDRFAHLLGVHDEFVGSLVERACTKFTRWGLGAGQVCIHLVAESGTALPTAADIAAALALEPLAESARVTSGAWLVAAPNSPSVSSGGGGPAGSGGGEGDDSLLSKLLKQQLAESAQRKLESEQRKLESEQVKLESKLRSVLVQRWDGPISSMVKLRVDFEVFFVEALAAVRVAGVARLYVIRDQRWAERQPLTSDTYAAFLQQFRDLGAVPPDVYVFEQMPGAQTSPLVPPVRQEQNAVEEEGPGKGGRASSSHGRNSAMQSDFRRALLRRDGSLCVLCRSDAGGIRNLEAAHIVALVAKQPDLTAAGLLNSNVPNNGIILCASCHSLHDAFMWCFDPSRGVVVAEALLSDQDLGPLWQGRVGAQLTKPDAADTAKSAWWPPASVWAVGLARFEAARVERHSVADNSPFVCSTCHKRFKKARFITDHKCDEVQLKLFTPQSARTSSTHSSDGHMGGGGGGK